MLNLCVVKYIYEGGGEYCISYSVYKHVNKINGKQYIGITSQSPENRWGRNGVNYRNSCPHFWNAIQKYGWDAFEHTVIASGMTKEQACYLETALIRHNNTQDKAFGYNIMSGGSAPRIPQEVREKMSAAMMGNKNGLGHPCSEEKKKKISDAQKNRPLTEEHRRKLSQAKKGKPRGPMSEETIKKISDSHEKTPVYCHETNTTYPSIQGCAKELGLSATSVCACCKGRIKSTGGYHFSYL